MEHYITKHPHHHADHITGKIPEFGRAVFKKEHLHHFDGTTNECGDKNDFEDGGNAKAVVMLVPDFTKEKQDGEHIEKAQVHHLVETLKKKKPELAEPGIFTQQSIKIKIDQAIAQPWYFNALIKFID
jgi:hypothetical protein